jgi:hypothetical protein
VNIYTVIGTLGALLILLGFYRIMTEKWTGKSLFYELDNLAGAVLLFIYQSHLHAYITATLNVIWVIVALKGITSYRQRAKK